MSTQTLDNHEPDVPALPEELDLHDLEAMQQIINQAAHAMSERIIALNSEVESTQRHLDTARDYSAKIEFRSEVLSGFANWIVGILEDPDVILDYGYIKARAAKALNAWPEETPEAVPPPRASADSRDWFPYPVAPEAAGA